MVSSMVFHVLPTALEISMVCGILVGGLSSCQLHIHAKLKTGG